MAFSGSKSPADPNAIREKIELTEKDRQLKLYANPPRGYVASQSSYDALLRKEKAMNEMDDTAIAAVVADEVRRFDSQKKEKSKIETERLTSHIRTTNQLSNTLIPDSNMRNHIDIRRSGLRHANLIISQCLANDPKKADLQAVSAYVCTAKPDRLSELFKPLLTKEKNARLLRLLQHVVQGEQKEAESILKTNPSLLLYRGRVEDYSFGETGDKHREIEGTAYQIALGAEDEEMAAMIQRHLLRLEKGALEIKRQQQQQFPESYQLEEIKKQEADLNALNEIVKAIGDSKATDMATLEKDCAVALQKFRNHLKPKDVIRVGKHFNIQMLLKAFELYDDEERYNDFGGRWDSPKNMFLWQKVIGYIQRFLPANYAQAFTQGIFYIVENIEPLKRSFDFRWSDSSFFPLDSDRFRLGYDVAVGVGVLGGVAVAEGWGPDGRGGPRALQSVCRAKTAALQGLCNVQTIGRRAGVS